MPPKGTKRTRATVESSADEALTTQAGRTVRKLRSRGPDQSSTIPSLSPAPSLSTPAAPAKTTARRRLPSARRNARSMSSVVRDSATEPGDDDDDNDEEREVEERDRTASATHRIVLVNKKKEGNKKLRLVLNNRSVNSASGTPSRSQARRAASTETTRDRPAVGDVLSDDDAAAETPRASGSQARPKSSETARRRKKAASVITLRSNKVLHANTAYSKKPGSQDVNLTVSNGEEVITAFLERYAVGTTFFLDLLHIFKLAVYPKAGTAPPTNAFA
ncbi:hypothetical protein B0T26DRAFT_680999 [Lasiosphaeria miniovina]|uniref:Uncharacterized protein n=1 Tax=Lasiosphaeria miniovina TaxID=1954250 RepID=A0AA39ZTH2_9PEZI|nr:uncharacterized protein B0T26DRAFT_680999 [Lasiosphaeria miniovina]KAK0703300.1 hypothetical protein B0T26DRAFT_680999 [Lasiosphaeria miniovina]